MKREEILNEIHGLISKQIEAMNRKLDFTAATEYAVRSQLIHELFKLLQDSDVAVRIEPEPQQAESFDRPAPGQPGFQT